MTAVLCCGSFRLPLDRPLIMGVLNVTPDSFSDGGCYLDPAQAAAHARTMIAEGADIIDIGGESTRPGAPPVPLEAEARRVLPVVEALAGCGVPLSVDTQKPALMARAVAAGASLINDVNGFEAPGALAAVAAATMGGAALCIMHKQGDPRTMQQAPHYDDVVREVADYLRARIAAAEAAGVARERLMVDPGFGFGKTLAHNLQMLRGMGTFAALGVPVLAGLSRKSMLGRIIGREAAGARLHASVAAALIAVQNGARVVRVHDVAATRDGLRVWAAVAGAAGAQETS